MERVTKKKLIEELRLCAEKILTETEIDKKIFFLDISSDLIGSYLLFEEKNEDLILAELILDVCRGTIVVSLEEESYKRTLLSNISELLDEIAKKILELTVNMEKEQPIFPPLIKIVVITHSITKHGIYSTLKK